MKLFTILSAVFAAASAAPALQAHPPPPTKFEVSAFNAHTIHNGNGAVINFALAIEGGPKTVCRYSDSTTDSRLPEVPYRPCDDPSVTWQFRWIIDAPGSGGIYLLVVIYSDNSTGRRYSGGYEWKSREFPQELYGGSLETDYRGPLNVTINAS